MSERDKLVRRLWFKRLTKNKFIAWRKRFLLAELCGALLAVMASYCSNHYFANAVIAAYAGAAGDTIGFYMPIIIQDATALRKKLHAEDSSFTWRFVLHLIKSMLLEFGPAEIIDSFFLRPFFMYYFPLLLHNYPLGILTGKLAGDITFYIPVTISNRLSAMYKKGKH
jgi:hypothetical protein